MGSSTSSTPSPSGGNGSSTAPALDPSIVAALVSIIQTGTSPQMLQIQQQLAQRLLLAGDVVPSRLPPPQNISEVGGYLNLLATLGQKTLQTEVLASALGVAPPPGLLTAGPGHPLAMVSLPNDRPTGNSQSTVPLTISVRSDFQSALTTAVNNIHSQGGTLPLFSPTASLPAHNPTFAPPTDWLPLIGRELYIMPTVALIDPTTDPIALASETSGGPYQLVALASGTGAPAAAAWYALAWSGGALTEIPLASAQFIPLAPLLATAGFYPASPLPKPAGTSEVSWAKLTNITGLVPGVSTLQSELFLLYCAYEIAGSALASYVQYAWNGTTFS